MRRIVATLLVACVAVTTVALAEEAAAPADRHAAVKTLIADGKYADADAAARAELARVEATDALAGRRPRW